MASFPGSEQAYEEWARKNGLDPNDGNTFRKWGGTPGPSGKTPEEEYILSQPGGQEAVNAKLDEDKNRDNTWGTVGTVAASLIPGVGPLAALGINLATSGARDAEDKRRAEINSTQVDPELQAFIDELRKPVDWNSPETKVLLGEARGAARRDAANRGLGTSGAGVENTQQAAENAKAKYGLQRQQLLSQALATKSGDKRALEELQLRKQGMAAQSNANADRNAIAIGGGLGQVASNLMPYLNTGNSGGGLGAATPQPTTGTSDLGTTRPLSDYAPPLNTGLSSQPEAQKDSNWDSGLRNA